MNEITGPTKWTRMMRYKKSASIHVQTMLIYMDTFNTALHLIRVYSKCDMQLVMCLAQDGLSERQKTDDSNANTHTHTCDVTVRITHRSRHAYACKRACVCLYENGN